MAGRGFACLVSLLSLTAGHAIAADIPVKAPKAPPPIVTAYDWTGFYVGGNVGYSVGRNPTETRFIGPAGLPPAANNTIDTLSPAGWLGGGQVGYNRQFGNFVGGVEADFQWTNQRDSACVLYCDVVRYNGFGQGATITQRLDWFGTLRGRVGYAWNHWLWYVTGGGVWAQTRTDDLFINTAGLAITRSNSLTSTKGGWVAGTGVETALGGNWTAKLEYLYMDLGSTSDSAVVVTTPNQFFPVGFRFATSSTWHDHIIRAGINYRLWPTTSDGALVSAAPGLIAKAPPPIVTAYDWTGFYVGGNVGYSVGRNPTETRFIGPAGLPPAANNTIDTLSPAGWLGGGQVGYNRQFGNFVGGVEADFQWTNQRDSACVLYCDVVRYNGFGQGATITQRLDWFGTLRGRVGYAWNHWLWYVSGGGVWAQTRTDDLFINTAGLAITRSNSLTSTKGGWVAGTGVETALGGNWTAKLEYLYMDLGSTSDSAVVVTTPNQFFPVGFRFATSSTWHDHIIRAGINYRIGG